ncbi:MFS transporter [Actinomyces sp. oral taxon 169]|uniref:peptide MFS transporter n=1 Tax=Actinomyces sp. oral taxon 169 TaxID=712116 RepID=UPI0015FEA290|nr:oligopeptide:H+ symporter [Actinomyces sp. oral taxon 169]QLF52725.1 MFS transporter [Actinomyces sp. oral taxon 169]
MSTTPTPVEDDLDTGRMIASRWRPATLRTTPSKQDRGLFGHPRGLPWMLNVEMWERFSYYGMRAILLYFITDTVARGGLGLSANSGQVILASYSAAVYLLAIPGGIFADRIIGPWLSTLYGGVVIMAGHICLSIPAPALAWTGIVLVAVGTGFIKPNLSTIVGGLYDDDDPRRDAGFQLFYMSVNLGSLASPLVTGWLREHYGYHAGFFSAAVGMGVALIAFIYGRHKLSAFAFTVPNPIRPQERRSFILASLLTVVAAAALVSVLNVLTGSLLDAISATMLIIPAGAALGYFVLMFRSPKVTARERTHLRAYIPLWIGAVLFFMISEQAAGKMATFAKDNTDGTIPWLGWAITPETYQSINPATIVILAPFIGWLFTRRAGRFPSTIMKFAISVLIIGGSAFILGYGFQIWPGGAKLSPWWFLAVVFIIQTVAELFLSPVGLSTTSALAPKNFASQTMSLWLLTTATGQGLAGFIISRTENIANSTYYYGLGAVTVAVAIILFIVAPWTERKMADVGVIAQN